jgi:hypothetical protein
MRLIIFLAVGFLGTGTLFQSSSVLSPKEKKIYKFAISNKDVKNFGYAIGGDGVPISVSDILIVDSLCYMLDPVHCNFKMINLRSGRITVSQGITTGRDEAFLTNLAEFNNYIYALSVRGTIYKYSKSGKLLKTIPIKDYFNEKFIHSVNKTHLTIFQDADSEPSQDGREWLIVKKLDSKDQVYSDKILMTYADEFSELRLRIHGKKYAFEDIKNGPTLKTDIGNFKLTKSISKIQYHPSINLDFTKKKVVYFENDGKQVTVYYNQY